MKKTNRVIFICVLVFISFYIGYKSFMLIHISELNVFLDSQEYVLRDATGHKEKVIILGDSIYLPVSNDMYLNYLVDRDDESVFLTSTSWYNNEFINFDTYTFDGERFTTDNIYPYDYTILFNWAPWCIDCKVFLQTYDFDLLKTQNIQFIGLPFYPNTVLGLKDIKKDVTSLINTLDLNFKNIEVTDELKFIFHQKIVNIPECVVLDNKSRIVNVSSSSTLDGLLKLIDALKKCEQC